MSISVAVKVLQVAVSFARSGRGPLPGPGNPGQHPSRNAKLRMCSVTDRGGRGSYSHNICRAKEVLAPNRHHKIPVPLYIPYFFMVFTVICSG